MVSFSLYEMYLKKDKETFKGCPNGLIIYSLDELKRKVVNVVLMILIITFFKFALNYEYKTIFDLLGLSVSIFFLALTIAIGRIKIAK
ncbi:MAG: YqhA family protein [Patescibacteria group bacterium]